jgi:hypothetical protein
LNNARSAAPAGWLDNVVLVKTFLQEERMAAASTGPLDL